MRLKDRFLAEEPGQEHWSGDELKSSKDLGGFGLMLGMSAFSWSVNGDMKLRSAPQAIITQFLSNLILLLLMYIYSCIYIKQVE